MACAKIPEEDSLPAGILRRDHQSPLCESNQTDLDHPGGKKECDVIAGFTGRFTRETSKSIITGSQEAEMAKYMTNVFLVSKVVFCNMMYDLALATGMDYEAAKKAWLMDLRIGESHTTVYKNDRGYGGSCFSKDTLALRYMFADNPLVSDFWDGLIKHNNYFRNI